MIKLDLYSKLKLTSIFIIVFSRFAVAQESLSDVQKPLKVAIKSPMPSYDPMFREGEASRFLYYLTMTPFVSINSDLSIRCNLCVSVPTPEGGGVELSIRNNEKFITTKWEIAKDAFWSDGEPITAVDVKYSWEVARSSLVTHSNKDVWESIKSIEVVANDDKKVHIVFEKGRFDLHLMEQFTVLPSHVFKNLFSDTQVEWGLYNRLSYYRHAHQKEGLYSGQYKIASIEKNQKIVLKRNSYFSPDINSINQVEIVFYDTLEGIIKDLDVIDIISEVNLTLSDFRRILKDSNYKFLVHSAPGKQIQIAQFNLTKDLLKDSEFRSLLNQTIDRMGLVSTLFANNHSTAYSFTHPSFKQETELANLDPQKTKSSLDALGLARRAGGLFKDNRQIELTIGVAQSNTESLQTATFLQSQWQKLGLKINIVEFPIIQFFGKSSDLVRSMDIAIYAIDLPLTPFPGAALPLPEKALGHATFVNLGHWKNESVEQLIDIFGEELRTEKKKITFDLIYNAFKKELPYLPLYYRSKFLLSKKNVEGIKLEGATIPSSSGIVHANYKPSSRSITPKTPL